MKNTIRNDLNLLTKDEKEELEKYVINYVKKDKETVQLFFTDLKAGNLKNKHIDIDALDFICDGLSEIVDKWIKENQTVDKENEMTSQEKIICGPNTKIGKFLSMYDKKQIDFTSGIKTLKSSKDLTLALNTIADIETRKQMFTLGDHDLSHTKRVILNAIMIMNLRNDISNRDKQIVLKAAEFHDTGRIHDFEDEIHGQRAAENITSELDDFDKTEQELIKFIMVQHCKSKKQNEIAISNLNITEQEKERYKLLLACMKDADKLDRVRFPEVIPGFSDSLDPNRLELEESKRLIKFACQSLDNFEELLNVDNNKSIQNLFSRKLIFAKAESGEQLRKSVERVLKENEYPERSKRLPIKDLKPLDEKFIKDGYIYLLRGSRKGQMSGFYTYPYSQEKINVEEFLRRNPQKNPDVIARNQSLKGKERFVSTTTNITVAAEFSKLDKANNTSGSIYVLKLKPEDVYRINSPVDLVNFYGHGVEGSEEEYLVPDFIKPEEIAREFKYNEYMEIYKYLTQEIGLNIELSDINLTAHPENQPELSDSFLDMINTLNEKENAYWRDNPTAALGFEMIEELCNQKNGQPVFDNMMESLFKMFNNPHDEDPHGDR